MVFKMVRNHWIIPATGSAEELERYFLRQSPRARDSSVNMAHSEEWRELGSGPEDFGRIWKFKIGENNEANVRSLSWRL